MIRTDAPHAKPYGKLRGLLKEYDYRQSDIIKMLGCSQSYFTQAINANTPWRLDFCYIILDKFHIPHSEFNLYFPKDGKAV